MVENLTIEKVSPSAIFFVDTRQFEQGLFLYDERIANCLLFYGLAQQQAEELEDVHDNEPTPILKANP